MKLLKFPVRATLAVGPAIKLLVFILPLVLLFGLWSACKDVDGFNTEKTAEVTFVGRIMDENKEPLSGAIVQAGDQSVATDLNGVFRLPATRLAANNARLHVRKSGYFEFSRAYVVENRSMQNVAIQLLAKTQVGSIPAAQGGVVQVPGGPTLTFPANGVMTANGNPYNGQVLVAAHFLDPTDPQLAQQMPGDLRGINTGGEEQSLATFGMVAVEINGTNGEPLQVATGSEVEIAIPIASSQTAAAPDNIPLWYFDLEKARWMEEGSAQKVGNQYIGKVKHFSCWNYDASYPSIILHGKVFADNNQHPLSNVQVWVGPADVALGWGYGHGTTDENGYFGGAVPQGVLLRIEVFVNGLGGPCGTLPNYSQTIGPFTSDVTLPDIILSISQVQVVTLTGRLVDCNQQPITNGYAKIQLSNGLTLTSFPGTDGTFETNFAYCTGSSISGQIKAYDLTNYRESAPQSFTASAGTTSIGDVAVCTALTEFIQYTLDGQDFTLINPASYSYASGGNTRTDIFTYDSLPANNSIYFHFYHNQQPGTFPLAGLIVRQFPIDSLSLHVNTTVSAFGNVGEPIVGTFEGTFSLFNSTTINSINGSYRVIRQ